MIYLTATQTQFTGHVDIIVIQTPAGAFTIEEMKKGDQPGQLVISSDLPLTAVRDGNSVIIGTEEAAKGAAQDGAS